MSWILPALTSLTGGGGMTGGPAGPSTASGSFDGSGWTVSTGGGSASAGPVAGVSPWLIAGGIVLLAVLIKGR